MGKGSETGCLVVVMGVLFVCYYNIHGYLLQFLLQEPSFLLVQV